MIDQLKADPRATGDLHAPSRAVNPLSYIMMSFCRGFALAPAFAKPASIDHQIS
jgi:hypothetical protein